MPPENAITPGSAEELAAVLRESASLGRTLSLFGQDTKRRMGGPVAPADVTVSTSRMTRVLQYEPSDLTISVEAGMRFRDLSLLLAGNRQMVPLDPPFSDTATVGGVLATNSSGPRRRLYGTGRDLVIGMKYATVEGKLIQSGGMVVKNVAGLDMGKLLIGSFGTLGAMAVVNFKLMPMPQHERHFVLSYDSLDEARRARDGILRGVLQPQSLDLLNPAAARILGLEGFVLSIETGGNPAVIERYQAELASMGRLEAAAPDLAARLREFTPAFLDTHPEGAVVRISRTLSEVLEAAALPGPVVARAGNGVAYLYCNDTAAAKEAMGKWEAIMEFSPESRPSGLELWPSAGSDLDIMRRVKQMFDPNQLLNRGRLFGRI